MTGMSLFQELEALYADLEMWQVSEDVAKVDVIRQTRSRVASIISYLLCTPHVGSAFCIPSDTLRVDQVRSDAEANLVIFESDGPARGGPGVPCQR